MNIGPGMVVTMHYELTDDNNDELESTFDAEPFLYLHGHGNIIPGLEQQIEGATIGQKLHATVYPAQGYGDRDPQAVFEVSRDQFDADAELEIGMMVYQETDQGTQSFTVTAYDENHVTLDGNHPYAGHVLHFDIEVLDIRPATAEELEHGHVHHGDHHHH